MRDGAVGGEAAELGPADVERKGPGELTPEPTAKAEAKRGERVLLRLHDHAHARTARQGRFQIIRKRRARLALRMGSRQHEGDAQRDKENHPTHW